MFDFSLAKRLLLATGLSFAIIALVRMVVA